MKKTLSILLLIALMSLSSIGQCTQLAVQNPVNFTSPPTGDTVSQAFGKLIAEEAVVYGILNNVRQGYIGLSAPANPEAGMTWIDTSVSPPMVRMRDSANANWLAMFPLATNPFNGTAGTMASAATMNIGASGYSFIGVTGTTTITAFDTVSSPTRVKLYFQGALTITYNATSMILPGAQNLSVLAGDIVEFTSLGSGNWICSDYQPKAGLYSQGGIPNATASNQAVALGQLLGSLGSSGYIKIPFWNGSSLQTLIVQWGTSSLNSGQAIYWGYPTSLSTGVVACASSTIDGGAAYYPLNFYNLTTSGCNIQNQNGATRNFNWVIIGY
ncbi:MAG: hypothetical protein P4N59_03380 [Negativicutes bacterium]|nr:hypothetical protein [Negativicutes bacterium]